MSKKWPSSVLIAVCWLGIVQAAHAEVSSTQQSFESPDAAANALVAALRDHRDAEWHAILGPDADRVFDTGGPYADQETLQNFLRLYDERHRIDQKGVGRAELDVGPDEWPFPIPMVESRGRWTFDTNAGAQSIIDRRIGRNELSAIRTLVACAEAQHEYFDHAKRTTGQGVYATRLISTPGHHDGLYWPGADGETDSPLGRLIDGVQAPGKPGGLADDKSVLHEGYYFRVLKAQGANAAGGVRSYIEFGRMTGGFAFIAWPAESESSGIMTFIVGPDGGLYQKDFGLDTPRFAPAMTTFDPDFTWSRVQVTHE